MLKMYLKGTTAVVFGLMKQRTVIQAARINVVNTKSIRGFVSMYSGMSLLNTGIKVMLVCVEPTGTLS